MSETTALTTRQQLTPQAWEMITSVAPAMFASRLFGVASPEQAMAIMLKGFELGLSLSASFEFVHVIQGKPGLSPRGALALIMAHPDFGDMKIEDLESRCRVWMKRRNGFEYTVEFSMDDAKRADLVKSGGGWQKYPANMLRWRAIGFCADVVYPDVLGGMKRTDELGADLSPEGDTLDGEWSVRAPAPRPEPRAEKPSTPAPEPERKEQATNGGNGRKTATITGPVSARWRSACEELVKQYPHYAKDGKPDYPHLVAAVAKLGYSRVDADNLGQVMRELADRVTAPAETEPPAPVEVIEAEQPALLDEAA